MGKYSTLLTMAFSMVVAGSTYGRAPVATDIAGSLQDRSRAESVQLVYLGAAGWQLTYGQTVLLIDPYLSRIPQAQRGVNDRLIPNKEVIDAHIQRADFILVHHSHFDHMLDVPYIAAKTGATIIGHESTANIAMAHGIRRPQLITVRGGEDFQFPAFSLRVIPSLHSPITKNYYDSRVASRDLEPPLRAQDYVEGGSLSYLIRIGGHQILTSGSMNYIERELEGLRPDVVFVGAGGSRRELYDYTGRLMRVLGFPALVIPTHWDDYEVPYENEGAMARPKLLESFVAEVKESSPKTRLVVPKYFEPIVLGQAAGEIRR